MTEEQLETLKRFAKFVRDTARNKAISVYNSDLVQNFIREYTGEELKRKLHNGKIKVIEGTKEAYEFMKPRVKIARKKAAEVTDRFIKFTQKTAKSVKESQAYRDFMSSPIVEKTRKYGRKALATIGITGLLLLGGKITKERVDYLNSDTHKMEICKDIEPLLFATIVHSEDWSDSAYNDGAGVATIGYGTTIYRNGSRVKLNDKNISCTLSQAEIDDNKKSVIDAAFAKGENEVISHLEKEVYPSMKKVKNFRKLSQEQQVALELFCYNVGCGAFDNSSVLSELNKGHIDQAFDNMLKYNKIKNKKGELVYARGLQKRRTYEYKIAKGELPLSSILDMPIASIYSDEAYNIMYEGKTAKDFAGENIVKPSGNNEEYLQKLKNDQNPKVRHCISKKSCEKIEKCYKMTQKQDVLAQNNQRTS